MYFESASRSVVRSIRQSELLNAWLRIFRRERAMPLIHQYEFERLEEEKPDLMHYEVRCENGGYRYMILHGGQNLVQAFGTERGEGRYLDDIVDAGRMASITPVFEACLDARRPIYTVATVTDVEGVPVDYERLALPFGANDIVQQLLVSLKPISTERRFVNKDLMRPGERGPAYQVCAVIDRELDASPSKIAVTDDVFEV
jgi:hypothetical protein